MAESWLLGTKLLMLELLTGPARLQRVMKGVTPLLRGCETTTASPAAAEPSSES